MAVLHVLEVEAVWPGGDGWSTGRIAAERVTVNRWGCPIFKRVTGTGSCNFECEENWLLDQKCHNQPPKPVAPPERHCWRVAFGVQKKPRAADFWSGSELRFRERNSLDRAACLVRVLWELGLLVL